MYSAMQSHAEEWVQSWVLVLGPRFSVPGPRSSGPLFRPMYSAMQSKILVLDTCYFYVGPTASHAEEWVRSRVLVLGPRVLVLGPRSPVLGPRSLVPGPRSLVPGPRVPCLDLPGPLFIPSQAKCSSVNSVFREEFILTGNHKDKIR